MATITPITHHYLIDLFYKIELKFEQARKLRSRALSSHALKEAMLQISEVHRERRFAVDLALTHGFDAFELMQQGHLKFVEQHV